MKMFLEVMLSLVTISIFAIFALRPTLVTIAELIREIEAKEETLAKMDEKLDDLNSAQALYDKELSKILLLDSSVPSEPIPELFVRQISGLSGKNNVLILKLTLGNVTVLGEETSKPNVSANNQGGTADEINFSLSAAGDYISLHNFLSDLEKLRRPAKFKILDFSSKEAEDASFVILTVEASTPYLKNNQL